MSGLSSANVAHLTYHDRHRSVIAICVCFPLSTLAVVLRFTARKISGAGLWCDDWLSFAGLLTTGVFVSLILVDLPEDSAIRGEEIPQSTIDANSKTVYVAELFYYITQFNLKASILAFYWRLFKSSSIRLPIYLTTTFVVIWFILSIFLTLFQCLPIAALWTPALKPSARCIQLEPFFFATSIPNILADLLLLALPMPYVWRLRITLTQKICVTGFMLLGSFVLVASAVRLHKLLLLDLKGFAAIWAVEDSVFWTLIENCLGVICICLPSLRPIVKLLPFGSQLGRSLDSNTLNNQPTRGSVLDHVMDKKDTQNDEYELLERDQGSCWVETSRSTKENSIETTEQDCITVQTNIHVSSMDMEKQIGIK